MFEIVGSNFRIKKGTNLGCLTDDEQSRALANVPTDLATIKNLSMSLSLNIFLNLDLTSSDVSIASSPLSFPLFSLESLSGIGGTQTRSSTDGRRTPEMFRFRFLSF